jgi:hypothetical protein
MVVWGNVAEKRFRNKNEPDSCPFGALARAAKRKTYTKPRMEKWH